MPITHFNQINMQQVSQNNSHLSQCSTHRGCFDSLFNKLIIVFKSLSGLILDWSNSFLQFGHVELLLIQFNSQPNQKVFDHNKHCRFTSRSISRDQIWHSSLLIASSFNDISSKSDFSDFLSSLSSLFSSLSLYINTK